MSGFASVHSGIAASIFLALYTFFLAFMCYVLFRKGWKTVYNFIFFFTLFRFGGQLCGVVYAKLGPLHWQWLIAYLVLGAEGYFALIFAAFRFTCKAQVDEFGTSWVLSTGPNVGFFILKRMTRTWVRIFHLILIPANALVISGGSMLAGIDPSEYNSEKNKITTSKALRTTGQALFLLMTFALIALNIHVYFNERVRNTTTRSVMLAAPFLIVRGLFGILSIYITKMNYFQLSNYSGNGIDYSLVIYEYVLSTTMEFCAAVILMSRFFSSKANARQDVEKALLTSTDK